MVFKVGVRFCENVSEKGYDLGYIDVPKQLEHKYSDDSNFASFSDLESLAERLSEVYSDSLSTSNALIILNGFARDDGTLIRDDIRLDQYDSELRRKLSEDEFSTLFEKIRSRKGLDENQ